MCKATNGSLESTGTLSLRERSRPQLCLSAMGLVILGTLNSIQRKSVQRMIISTHKHLTITLKAFEKAYIDI